ncbi:hypothetical protein Pint_11342 [Pistacia integerrima]|uniref:Uncharacterized protein n=1 Tax=Pistacia integerrima TaxID=434235 RepID=A0ACC0XJA0_9ROSI|nr:hypothetical protein Pint_11342 [Pistacia integerrima]
MSFLLQHRLSFVMGSRRTSRAHLLTLLSPSNTCLSQSSSHLLPALALKSIDNSSNNHHPLTLNPKTKTNDFFSAPGNRRLGLRPLDILTIKLKGLGMDMEKCVPCQYSLLRPACNGGDSEEKSLSVYISPDGVTAIWVCCRAKCEWKGCMSAFGDSTSSHSSLNQIAQKKTIREISEEGLRLGPLCDQVPGFYLSFFLILKRLFYGLDDIEGESDIIIVEGEMDKLSMEEVKAFVIVSVHGAPAQVSTKDLPPKDKASRIILATDGDLPGQALAEELACRLGKERCWRVKWPKSYKVNHFKVANEVLMYLGPQGLKEVIENAKLYPISGLYNFRDYFDEIDAYYYQQPRFVRVNLPCSSLHSVASLFPLEKRDTEKWSFGLNEKIKEAAEIIIVEGEIDKLAIEAVGFLNCVSVPCGVPQKVSAKALPQQEKDTGYQYIWYCKEHLDKDSCIILVTEGDIPGQALAEELARHLGKQRCWHVQWPKKDELCCFNDANEVLMFLGGGALKEVIKNVELYQLQVLDQAKMQCT